MTNSFPRSWESLDSPPSLRELSDSERQIIKSPQLPKDALTRSVAVSLVTLYAKAVGYENERQITDCIKAADLWDYDARIAFQGDEVVYLDPANYDWRIGSPDWPHTKLTFHEAESSESSILEVGIYSNTPYDNTHGLSERDIAIRMYFAEMATGFLAQEARL